MTGAVMVHPRVLEMSGIDATVYSGFVLITVKHVAMHYGINDTWILQRDVHFSEQFK